MRTLHNLPVGNWYIFDTVLHRKLSDTMSVHIRPDGSLYGDPFLHNLNIEILSSEDMTASMIAPQARLSEFVNLNGSYTIETVGDWNHPAGTLVARPPVTTEEAEDESLTFSGNTGKRFMDIPRCTEFKPRLPPLSSYPLTPEGSTMSETAPKKPQAKPLKLVRSAQRQAELDMVLRTHPGGEPKFTLQGRTLNGKATVTLSRGFGHLSPATPPLDLEIEDLSLDEARALRDYFDALAADITETRV